MKKQSHYQDWIQMLILTFFALFITSMVFIADIFVPLGVAVGAMYCIVIFYSWLLPGRLTPIYTGIFCTVLIVLGLVFAQSRAASDEIFGVNRVISVIVIWVCTALVMMAKNGFKSLEEARDQLEQRVKERTKELSEKQRIIELSNERYKSLLESAPDAMVIAERNGTVQLINQQITNLFGYEKDELLGTSVERLIPERYRRLYKGHSSGFFDIPDIEQQGKGVELIGRKKSGEEFPIEVSLSPLETDDGALVSAAIRDITFRKDAEDSMELFSQQLQNKNKELEQFTYVASHDLQEPLRTITSFSEMLVEKYKNQFDETGKKSLQFILDATGRMSQLIKGLLDYGRLGKSEAKENINCNDLMADLKKDLTTGLEESKTKLDVSDLPSVNGYPVELRLLLQNLISNAMKFRKPEETPVIQIKAKKKRGEVVFSVKDNGIGIADEHRERIFEIFQRLHNKNKYEGTGIGLAHCRKIVELHGGQIWVESEPDMGSSFYFSIPK
ncbi:sensor histidine kinase [Reichenbachiella sp.]|uniref:sensor histidine kinase n=1 Tax=Reichenbachiella sp. TaxID=2184521 RepID=UPI003BAF79D3